MVRRLCRLASWSIAIAAVLVAAAVLSGCGGGDAGTGGAAGWVYQPIGGGQPIVSAVATPPTGYEPVVGAVVTIDGYPDLTSTTGSGGEYLIMNIPPGSQGLTVTVGGTPVVSLSIPIVADQITLGGGHQEGGG